MPAIDFTLWVRDRLLANDTESNIHLFSYLAGGSEVALGNLAAYYRRKCGTGSVPEDPNSIDTPATKTLRLILETQDKLSAGERELQRGLQPDLHWSYPAFDLRSNAEPCPPAHWAIRWAKAGGPPLFDVDRFIAPKKHLVWREPGDADLFKDALGVCYMPFWIECEAYVAPISRGECESLGMLVGKGNWIETCFASECQIPSPTPRERLSPEQRVKLAALKMKLEEHLASILPLTAEKFAFMLYYPHHSAAEASR